MNQIKQILVPIDFSNYSRKALNYASDFAKQFNASLILIYVVEPMVYPADFSMGQVALPSVDTDLAERASKELETLQKSEMLQSVKTRIIIKTGKPFIEIIETAAELDVDLIIIATHGHTGVEHLLFGSTAEKVVRKAPCPVLTLREPIKGYKYFSKD